MQTTTLEPPRKTTPSVDVKLILPFVNAVQSVFQTMVHVPTKVNPPKLKDNPCPTYDYSGIIGFSGDVVGNVVISLQTSAAKLLVDSFAGTPIDPGSPDFADAIGELANMIAGAAKRDLGNAASISIPSIIVGRGHQIARMSDVPCIVIPCTTSAGDFAVEVNIKQVNR